MLCAVHRRKEHNTGAHGLPGCAPRVFSPALFDELGKQTLRVWELRICIALRGRRQRDCRADAVALGAGHTAHGRLLSQAKAVPSPRAPLAIQSVLLSPPKRLRRCSFTPLTYSAVLAGEQQVTKGLDLNRFSAN